MGVRIPPRSETNYIYNVLLVVQRKKRPKTIYLVNYDLKLPKQITLAYMKSATYTKCTIIKKRTCAALFITKKLCAILRT